MKAVRETEVREHVASTTGISGRAVNPAQVEVGVGYPLWLKGGLCYRYLSFKSLDTCS